MTMFGFSQPPIVRHALGAVAPAAKPSVQDVFVSRTLDAAQPWEIVRIPALCRTSTGTLLAFAEARQAVADQSSNMIVLRRRLAGSSKWQPAQIVAHDAPASLNNPCVLVVHDRILLMYQRYPQGTTERTAATGPVSAQTCRTLLQSSSDDGVTWSAPRDITSAVRSPESRSDACGPGIGIQLQHGPHAGRLLFPFNEGVGGRWRVFAVYSDDGGSVWQRGETAPTAPAMLPNETQFAERSDGSVLINSRDQGGSHTRLVGISKDGGETWSPLQKSPGLPDPECMASLLRFSFHPDLLVFCNPADPVHRRNGTIRLSHDGGGTWQMIRVVAPRSFGYSCMCVLPRSRVGLLYEVAERSGAGSAGYRIVYTTVPITVPRRSPKQPDN
ncbi:MAG: exo-alpha-sialidase [Armatimonadetes bacterium]|nr:exo-alpha-sialidase [Armatimonadota bacterium]MDE2207516.1 exo-alpha-sialidase [Armatimonadota bacterium]